MTEWKNVISSSFVEANSRRVEIHKSLNSLLAELKREDGIHSADFDLISEHPLSWIVTVNKKKVQITESEVTSIQSNFEGSTDISPSNEEKKDVAEALKKLLVQKLT
ncbi:hypothetical protein [Paenibacillus sp. W2I17]|uniref:hypothetical protein n=1 Tax=Paenibacillus sp. W2I17 TaxID=3042311 RepID=UPI00278B4A38|nr:hypothetical protein [Paenibacillus sp. W2I17]MDQ0658776.1 hypothetical protein [Paenibacillus sp. W2I17]